MLVSYLNKIASIRRNKALNMAATILVSCVLLSYRKPFEILVNNSEVFTSYTGKIFGIPAKGRL